MYLSTAPRSARGPDGARAASTPTPPATAKYAPFWETKKASAASAPAHAHRERSRQRSDATPTQAVSMSTRTSPARSRKVVEPARTNTPRSTASGRKCRRSTSPMDAIPIPPAATISRRTAMSADQGSATIESAGSWVRYPSTVL